MSKDGQKSELPKGLRLVVAARVARLMQAHGLQTAEELAAKVPGLTRNTARRLLAGATGTKVDTIEAISQAFQIEPWKLLLQPEDQSKETGVPAVVTQHTPLREVSPRSRTKGLERKGGIKQ